MPHWLLVSIVVSVILTVALNLIIRLFPDAIRRVQDKLLEQTRKAEDEPEDTPGPRVRIWFPWKFMLAASIGLTLLLNLLAWLARISQSG